MKTFKELPEGYSEKEKINMQKDKKTALTVNIAALVVMAVMVAIGFLLVDAKKLASDFFGSNITWRTFVKDGVIIGGYIIYIYLHEITHGVVMKKLSGVKPKYGFNGLYAYAGNSAYFDRKSYIIVALAPLVLFGFILGVTMFFVPQGWGVVPYVIQIGNVSGAMGDLFVTFKVLRMNKDVLINDTGLEMTFYTKK